MFLTLSQNSLTFAEIDAKNTLFQKQNLSSSESLNSVKEQLSSKEFLEANFKQIKKIAVLDKPLLSSGKVILANKKGFYWSIIKPYQQDILVRDDTLFKLSSDKKWVKAKGKETKTVEIFGKMFSNIFEGNFKDLEKYFDIYFEKNNSSSFSIGLLPKHSKMKKAISGISLRCEKDLIKELEISETNGDNNRIIFSDMAFNSKNLPEFLLDLS